MNHRNCYANNCYMHHLKTFEQFHEPVHNESLLEMGQAVNEGLLDRLFAYVRKVLNLFKDPDRLKKSLNASIVDEGDRAKKFLPKSIKINETYVMNMGEEETDEKDFSIAFTKLANLPDSSSLFQISGTSSVDMLKALVGSDKGEDLTKNSIMAIISSTGFEDGKAATMRLLKNILPGGKDYVTSSLFKGAVPIAMVEKTLTSL